MTGPLIVLGVVFVGSVAVAIGSELRYNRERRRLKLAALHRDAGSSDYDRQPLQEEVHFIGSLPAGFFDRAEPAESMTATLLFDAETDASPRAHGRFNCRGDYLWPDGRKTPAEALGIEPAYGELIVPDATSSWYVPAKPSKVVTGWMVHHPSRSPSWGPYRHRKTALRKARQLNGQT